MTTDETPRGCVPYKDGIMIVDWSLDPIDEARLHAGKRLLGPDPLWEAGREFVPTAREFD